MFIWIQRRGKSSMKGGLQKNKKHNTLAGGSKAPLTSVLMLDFNLLKRSRSISIDEPRILCLNNV